MRKIAILAVLLLCIAAVMGAGCVTQEEPEELDYATALIGDWKSSGTYETDGGIVYQMTYHFNADNTGTLNAVAKGETLTSVDIFWGHVENNGYIVGYTTTGAGDYLYISEDGKTLINEFGETFTKV